MIDDDVLLGLVRAGGRQLWLGQTAPFEMDAADAPGSTNFRLAAHHHGAYDVVWVHERPLSDFPATQWPLLLDEALRCLGRRGRLVLRYRQDERFSIIALKAWLFARPTIHVSMGHDIDRRGVLTSVFEVERENLEAYSDDRWSFVLLAQGNRMANVMRFLDGVERLSGGRAETVIVGPRFAEYDRAGVTVLDRPYRNDRADIALKKNDGAEAARHSNLCFLHDRYVLDDDFFEGFEKFGYDFDFVAVRQRYTGGEPYPFYAAGSGAPLMWTPPIDCRNYQVLRPGQYVNGGFMVFKRPAFRQMPLNPLLAWNQGEDVEVAARYVAASLPPRVNLLSGATTNVDPSHTAAFRGEHAYDRAAVAALGRAGRSLELRIRSSLRRLERGVRHALRGQS